MTGVVKSTLVPLSDNRLVFFYGTLHAKKLFGFGAGENAITVSIYCHPNNYVVVLVELA